MFISIEKLLVMHGENKQKNSLNLILYKVKKNNLLNFSPKILFKLIFYGVL